MNKDQINQAVATRRNQYYKESVVTTPSPEEQAKIDKRKEEIKKMLKTLNY